MSKAVLVIDMPDNCGLCLMARLCNENYVMCSIDRMTMRPLNEAINNRPDWCPLAPIPERATEPIDLEDVGKDYSDGSMDGWNACLDEITE